MYIIALAEQNSLLTSVHVTVHIVQGTDSGGRVHGVKATNAVNC